MPQIIVYCVEGQTAENKKKLMKGVTDAVVEHFGSNPEAVIVQIVEAPKTEKSKGGVPFSER